MAEVDQTYAPGERPSQQLASGSQLGRFTLRRVLGEGGMGVVWAAHDPDLDREIALKVLRHHATASEAMRKRLLREARAMARLKHPNVLTVYEVGSSGDTDFIALELVDGVTMDVWLAQDPPRDDVWHAVIAAGRGLAAAHAAGLVHRDFKPHNVLRGRDGRVLVTDFGLARGLGEEVGEAAVVEPPADVALDKTLDATPPVDAWELAKQVPKPAQSSSGVTPRADSVLDSPLTQTGAMIGTPAYMAPEQFHGAPPDPRTDQFAFCITAWQALTGARPFSGETLEELRRSAAAGVDGVVADLAKDVRAVLARGLARDPAVRWPDLGALLDALDAARRPRRRIWPYVLASAVVVTAIVVAAIAATRRPAPRAPAVACEPAEQVFAEVWSDGARADFGTNADQAAVSRAARAFEQLRTKWTASYQDACNAPPSKLVDARLACLRGVRDEAAAWRVMLRDAEPRVWSSLDLSALLPNLAICTGTAPIAPPEIPREQPRRGQIIALVARAIALRGGDAIDATAIDRLLHDAAALGWPPLVPMIQISAGTAYLRRHDLVPAREAFRQVAKDADIRFQALAQLGLLEASVYELEQPGDGALKPGAPPAELARLLTYARSTVRGAGNDPMLAGEVARLEAEVKAGIGMWSQYRQPYTTALELTAEARKAYEKAGELRRAADVAAYEGWIYLWRGNERALDDALYVARSAEEALGGAQLDRSPALDELRAKLAAARGDFREAHRRFDGFAPSRPPGDAVIHRGRVVGRDGKPIAGATVVLWTGELHGDPDRAYTDPRFVGEIVDTATDGTFEVHSLTAPAALIAETADLRSAPHALADGVTLVVEPKGTATGTIAGERFLLVDAVARYAAGGASWFVHAPIAKDGTYQLAGLPRGAYALGAIGPAGHGTRRATGPHLAWPTGAPIEIVLRGPVDAIDHDGAAWVFRGRVVAKTREEAETLAARATDVATTRFHPIGADATEAGREVYEAGDRHAIVSGNPPGEVTVCVTLVDLRDAPVFCQALTVGRDAVTPVLFKTE